MDQAVFHDFTFTEPAQLLVEQLGRVLLPVAERTRQPGVDALRLLNRAYPSSVIGKKSQRLTDFAGFVLAAGQRPVVLASMAPPPHCEAIDLRPAGHRALVEAIHAMVSWSMPGAGLVVLTQKRGGSLESLRVSYPGDIIWICRSGDTPRALSRQGYAQLLSWHAEGKLKPMRELTRLLQQRHSASDVNLVDRNIDKLVDELQQNLADLYAATQAINGETWAWAQRLLHLRANPSESESIPPTN